MPGIGDLIASTEWNVGVVTRRYDVMLCGMSWCIVVYRGVSKRGAPDEALGMCSLSRASSIQLNPTPQPSVEQLRPRDHHVLNAPIVYSCEMCERFS